MYFKMVKGQRSYEVVKTTHTLTIGKWFDHSCFKYTVLNS